MTTDSKFLARFLTILVALCAGMAQAEWPHDKPIKFIIPYGPGGFDSFVRIVSPGMEMYLGAVVVPENRPGAGGRIAANTVYRAKPDGYTIGIWNMPGMTLPAIVGEKVRYDLDKLTWIAQLGHDGYGLAVRTDSPIRSLEDLCDLGRQATFSAQGGLTETASIATVITMVELGCPYKLVTGYQGSSQATLAVMRGDVDARINPIGSLLPYVDSGDVRLLVTFEEQRSVAGVPTIAELGHGEFVNFGLRRIVAGPPGMPEDIRDRLSAAMIEAMQSDEAHEWSRNTNNPFSPLDSRQTASAMQDVMRFYEQYGGLLRAELKGE
jgi:tripartite-type tricarboxylate transporter receptor subunit TctC